MYSLDINFLKDPERDILPQDQGAVSSKKQLQMGEMTPLIIGAVVGILPLALVAGLWLVMQQQTAKLEKEQAEVTRELERSEAQRQRVVNLQKQINKTNAETEALANVFDQIKPWSAMLQDIRERTPPGVQIRTVKQTEVESDGRNSGSAKAQASSDTRPKFKLEISGTARSFDDVNYFILTLKNSSFLKTDQTQLIEAQLIDNPTKLEVPETQQRSAAQAKYELPKVVDYTIHTNLSNIPASELLRELDSKGAVGLVTRIRTLQEKGVIQP
ncbi:MAG: fimbrial assembly protein [Symploca sp. SIO3C6]|uniref:Fimbrial assembly protein n=1 Tax=Symploca sp. SIO1C4 TaxID=2607765 RepID=A0A6B3NG57_9CYAN|nr:fimbrial assembly protein [Symploca sp. SIO3C6]NER28994.1 fimbrial assembly protein [Symploca sp. SIO1C4]NET06708.1 fimbrial assembly protein [Symploca sp. SIO2B6]